MSGDGGGGGGVAVSEDIDITSLGGGSLISSCGDITRL